MSSRILITGGAGFAGSHLADELLLHGYEVRVLDTLSPQVHGNGHGGEPHRPDYLHPAVELFVGDIRDPAAVRRSLEGVEAVFHFAAAVGVGQSMYEIVNYTSTNDLGTAVLLEALATQRVEKLVVASSMSIYGEGLYRSGGRLIAGSERSLAQLQRHDWEVRGTRGEALDPYPTPESKRPGLPSVYAITKYHQECLCLNVGRAYGIPTVALRFFNIFGPRQSLSNPYTGVLAIFASRLLNNQPPLINEDGRQQRDFVSVSDVARACRLALATPEADGRVFNIGSGTSYSILEIAHQIARVLDKGSIEPQITGKYRVGDIRNCFADITLARECLGYQPQVTLEEGLLELAEWLEGRTAIDGTIKAREELASRGLTV